MFPDIRIVRVVCLVCKYLLFLLVYIQIGKVCIAFFQIIPSGLVSRIIIKYTAQHKAQTVIYFSQISIQLRRIIHDLKKIFPSHRRILFLKSRPEVPAVRINLFSVGIHDTYAAVIPLFCSFVRKVI